MEMWSSTCRDDPDLEMEDTRIHLSNSVQSTHIVVVGEMGVGKTTIGRLLAQALGRPFLDSDEMVETETGVTGAEIAASEGVSALHDRELEVFEAMNRSSSPAVLAPAASVVDRQEGRDLLRKCTTIWLVVPEAVLAERQRRGHHRRAVDDEERTELEKRRDPHLEEIADIEVDTGTAGPQEVVGRVLKTLSHLA
jgi:shikimate kinase